MQVPGVGFPIRSRKCLYLTYEGTTNAMTDSQTTNYSDAELERQLRIELAACYRLVNYFGWDDLIFTHISARVPGTDDAFLINPYGLTFDEVTASNLVKIDIKGNKLEPSPYPINPAGFVIHSAIHAGAPEAHVVLHTHTPEGVAVGIQKRGLLPISQQASIALASIAYHDYEGIALRDEEKARLVTDLGDNTNFMLRNHGLITVGEDVASAFLGMFNLLKACEIQIKAQAGGGELIEYSDTVQSEVSDNLNIVLQASGPSFAWPSLMRLADRKCPGYRD